MASRHSFTLIELLLVIANIGVLAGIVIMAINPSAQLTSARDAKRRADQREIKNAIEQFVIQYGAYPGDKAIPSGSGNATSICRQGASASNCINLDSLVSEEFVASLPVDTSETDEDLSGYSVYLESNFVQVVANHLGEAGGNGAISTPGEFQTAIRLGGTSEDRGNHIATDSNGNIIIAGYVRGDADLNNDGDTADGIPEDGNGNANPVIAYAVFDSTGSFQHAKRIGSTGANYGNTVAIDNNDNIMIGGSIQYSADINGDGDFSDSGESSGYGSADAILSVFDSSGTFQLYKKFGGTGFDQIHAITSDSNNNIIVAGTVVGTGDLNGDGDTSDTNETGSAGNYDTFLSVFDSSGNFQFSKRISGSSYDIPAGVATDGNDNIILVSSVTGAADLNGDGDTSDTNEGSGYGNYDTAISVFDSSGTFQFSKRLGGTGGDRATDVTTDSSNNIYVAYYVQNAGDLNGDGDTADANESTGSGSTDMALSVFDSSGNFQFAKRIGSTGGDQATGVAIDSNDNIVISGYVVGATDFNADGDTTDAHESTNYGGFDAVVVGFNSSGDFQFARRWGGSNNDYAEGIAIGANNDVIVGGHMTGDADVNSDGDENDAAETGLGNMDMLISIFDGF